MRYSRNKFPFANFFNGLIILLLISQVSIHPCLAINGSASFSDATTIITGGGDMTGSFAFYGPVTIDQSGGGSGGGGGSTPDYHSDFTQLNLNLNQLNASINQTNQITQTNTIGMTNLGSTIESNNVQLTQLNQNSVQLNQSTNLLNQSTVQLNQSTTILSQSTTQLSQSTAQLNQSTAQLNSTLQQFLNPAHALLMGAELGVGMALGTTAISVAIASIKITADWIYEAITHQKRNAALLDAFGKASDYYPKIRAAIDELMERVDSYIFVVTQMKAAGGIARYTEDLNLLIRELEMTSRSMGELSIALNKQLLQTEAASLSIPTQQSASQLIPAHTEIDILKEELHRWNQEASKIDAHLRNAIHLRETLASLTHKDICRRMNEEALLLIKSESALQDVRIKLIDPLSQKIWEKAWNKQIKESLKYSKRIQKKKHQQSLWAFEESSAQSQFELQIHSDPALKHLIHQAWRQCLRDHHSWIGHVAVLGSLFSSQLRNECWAAAIDPSSKYTAPYKELIQPIFNARKRLLDDIQMRMNKNPSEEIARFNPDLNAEAMLSYHHFFKQLEQDQTFYETGAELNLLQAKKARIEQLCKDELIGDQASQ